MASLRRAVGIAAAIALAAWLALAVLAASSQPTGEPPMRSVPVVTDRAIEATTHIVIEGALP